jgi:hypothetical protein
MLYPYHVTASTIARYFFQDCERFLRDRAAPRAELDADLSRGLTSHQLEGVTQAPTAGFRDLHLALGQHGQRLEEMLDTLHQVVIETPEAVLDLRAEMQRQGQQLQTETRAVDQAVVKLLEERDLHARLVRPLDSLRGVARRAGQR